jgi:hypothetical protein
LRLLAVTALTVIFGDPLKPLAVVAVAAFPVVF